jgi:hypothetical protein
LFSSYIYIVSKDFVYMLKRGYKAQVSLFIILAIFIFVIAFIGVYIARSNGYLGGLNKDAYIETIKANVQDCIDKTALDSLYVIGIQGGYYNPPEESFDLGWAFIPYYYDDGKILMPKNSKIESELGLYFDNNFNLCLSLIDIENTNLLYDKPSTTVKILPGKAQFIVDMPLTIQKNQKKTKIELKEFKSEYDSKLYEILELARYITDSHKEDPEFICVDCVTSIAKEKELNIEMIDFMNESSTTLMVIYETKTSDLPYIFEFLNKYPIYNSTW